MSENPFDGPYGDGSTEYERYLRIQELLDLPKPAERRSHPDELMFQVIHQVEELWMKLVIHEMGQAVKHLDQDRFAETCRAFERIDQVQELCEQQLRLFSSMLPSAYIHIRKGLGSGSGLDSPGFKRIHELAPTLWERYQAALERGGVDLLEMYQQPDENPELLAVAECLVSFDAQMQRFKLEHLMTVRRIIGMGTASLRGNPADMLDRSSRLTFFPMLWAVRDRLFLDFKTGPLQT